MARLQIEFNGRHVICRFHLNVGNRFSVHQEPDRADRRTGLHRSDERPRIGKLHFNAFLLLGRKRQAQVLLDHQVHPA